MRTENIKNVGVINMSNMTLMDDIQMYIDIQSLSDDLKTDVEKAIEESKVPYAEKHKVMIERYGLKWGNSGFNESYQLEVSLKPDWTIDYFLSVFYEDKECEDLCDSIYLDLPEYHKEEFKRIAFNALMEKFSLGVA